MQLQKRARIGTNYVLPYLLFIYREVPQESTGFLPFELPCGRAVRDPLDVLCELWEASKSQMKLWFPTYNQFERRSKDCRNYPQSQLTQKRWYDHTARTRSFKPGDQVFVLFPTSTNKLEAKWQGPYLVEKRVGKVDYHVKIHDRKKENQIFHVNMLQKWNH